MNSEALIELVKHYPQLYSKQQTSGSTIEHKNAIWKEIAGKLQQPVEKCKAKWRNLRDSYQKSIKYRRELEAIGKEDLYHEYKHENALSFLEVGSKRKANDGEKRSKPAKKPREEYFETSYIESQEGSPSHNEEYIIESEQDNTDYRDEDDDEDQSILPASVVEESQFQEIASEPVENNENIIKSEATQTVCLYETRIDAENESTPHEEITYQETFLNESAQPLPTSELDSWLNALKQTLLSFPKVTRARAKKKINDIVSDLEISYLESMELDPNQSS